MGFQKNKKIKANMPINANKYAHEVRNYMQCSLEENAMLSTHLFSHFNKIVKRVSVVAMLIMMKLNSNCFWQRIPTHTLPICEIRCGPFITAVLGELGYLRRLPWQL